ncbi:MAG: ribosome silencing factor [Pelolinea sp.]|nr:ribosome silencing factor [Pelolinea sp.]
MARELVNALEEKKAEDIALIDIRDVAIFTDFFVICSATSDRMIRALVKAAEDTMISKFRVKARVMGSPSNGWVAVDFTDIVLHVFSPKQREYYQLEELWSNGKTLLRVK